jgi:hypothetical protein
MRIYLEISLLGFLRGWVLLEGIKRGRRGGSSIERVEIGKFFKRINGRYYRKLVHG